MNYIVNIKEYSVIFSSESSTMRRKCVVYFKTRFLIIHRINVLFAVPSKNDQFS